MPEAWKNRLYFGDNLDFLGDGKEFPESADLIYLDPPFNSQATYNVLFKEKTGAQSSAQIKALGVFICLSNPTKDMKTEAAAAGLFSATVMSTKKVPKLQLLTVEDLFGGHGVQYPSQILETTHPVAERQAKGKIPEQGKLL